ncbi:protein toll-like, partial [Epargyreus clarus]|uniref:protein toll-like n=1 Tax=Epargyreus clarus TaxID=520877 RepID=UPI003C2F8812
TVAPRALDRLDNLNVDLSNNNLTIAPTSLLKAKIKVRLAGNRFECDCDHHDSITTLELYSIQVGDHAELQYHDDNFVEGELVLQLVGGRQPLRLCLHYRDWEIGGLVPEQITRSVSESRRTIVVISREFLGSNWGWIEFRAAHALDRVILLLRGDVLCAAREDPELRPYLITNTYAHADDPLVWDRLRDTVLRSRRRGAPSVLSRPAFPAPTFPLDPRNLQ